MNRRTFIKLGTATAGALSLNPVSVVLAAPANPTFQISLAQWSLNRALFAKQLDNLDFPRVARRDYGIDCVEFVDQFFADKSTDQKYLRELKKRLKGEGVKAGLIMLDTNGELGASDQAAREKAVEKTIAWIDAAKFLGCRTVRINAHGAKDPDELRRHMTESCGRLADYAGRLDLNLAIENHGGHSSDPKWLVSLMQAVNHPRFGTLPDFGNFEPGTDRYDAVEAFMPYAKAVSAKAIRFSPEGEVVETDFRRIMRIVRDGGYHSYMGVECEAEGKVEESAAIKMTRDLLLRIREEHARLKPVFNGRDLTGWTKIEGGEWSIENGVLIGHHGRNWSTNPEVSGSWLSTRKQYGDFRLELQYNVNQGGNSGVLFRSSHVKNPSFTGYEMQIYDGAGKPPSKSNVGALYDLVAPSKNTARPAGQWNSVTIVARGPKITVELNGERIIDTEQTRSLRGYIGLQNHDDKAVVKFKNVRLEEL